MLPTLPLLSWFANAFPLNKFIHVWKTVARIKFIRMCVKANEMLQCRHLFPRVWMPMRMKKIVCLIEQKTKVRTNASLSSAQAGNLLKEIASL